MTINLLSVCGGVYQYRRGTARTSVELQCTRYARNQDVQATSWVLVILEFAKARTSLEGVSEDRFGFLAQEADHRLARIDSNITECELKA